MPTEPPRDRHVPDLIPLVDAAAILHMTRQGLRKSALLGQILGANIRIDNGRRVWVFRRALVEREAGSPEGMKRIEAWHAKHPSEACFCQNRPDQAKQRLSSGS